MLEKAGGWTPEWQEELEAEASRHIEEAVDWAESLSEPTFQEMLERMYGEPTQPLIEQMGAGDDE